MLLMQQPKISIHAPRAGRDPLAHRGHGNAQLFQSTRPVRGATAFDREADRIETISIHAPRAGRDQHQGIGELIGKISIHAPRAGRDTGDPVIKWFN